MSAMHHEVPQVVTPGEIVTLTVDRPPFKRGARVRVIATGIHSGERTLQLEDHFDKRGWVKEGMVMSDKTATAQQKQQAHLWRVEDKLPTKETARLQLVTTPDGKKCTHCKETKPREGFYKKSGMKDGLQSWCKACHIATERARVEKQRAERKVCSGCKKLKPLSAFYQNGKGIHFNQCGACIQALRKERREAKAGIVAPQPLPAKKPYVKPMMVSAPPAVSVPPRKPSFLARLRFLFTGKL